MKWWLEASTWGILDMIFTNSQYQTKITGWILSYFVYFCPLDFMCQVRKTPAFRCRFVGWHLWQSGWWAARLDWWPMRSADSVEPWPWKLPFLMMVNCYVKIPEGKRILLKNQKKYAILVACFCWWFEVQGNKNISFGNQMWLAGKSLINVGFTGHLTIPHRTARKEPQMSLLIHAQRQSLPPDHIILYMPFDFNIAMENVPFMDDLLVFTS